jgi:hypothetical protein
LRLTEKGFVPKSVRDSIRQAEYDERHTKTCKRCGKPFVAHSRQVFCSNFCRDAVFCEFCGKPCVTKTQKIDHICSPECWKLYYAKLREQAEKEGLD